MSARGVCTTNPGGACVFAAGSIVVLDEAFPVRGGAFDRLTLTSRPIGRLIVVRVYADDRDPVDLRSAPEGVEYSVWGRTLTVRSPVSGTLRVSYRVESVQRVLLDVKRRRPPA